ncbi:hypothetical protein [Thalassotalea piscium]|uniref:Uncharacterized protein n=1 Tax=Thalassotalea piscium TaxID=1230533 RepID=A0A7X0NJX1_9GAMM|nr:hypothetical protein [Thalassotalea piscium]MBB6544766.1 hypothetical protein [Thalassotalea piscium]
MTQMSEEHQPTVKRSLYLLNSCIEGFEIAIDMVSQAKAIDKTYTYLEAEKGLDYKLHKESFGCAKYIMDEMHKLIDVLPDGEESKKVREKEKSGLALLDFVSSELKKFLCRIISSRNGLEASLSMHEALSQLNLDEDGFRYKFFIEDHIMNVMAANDGITEYIHPVIIKAFKIRKYRIGKLQELERNISNSDEENTPLKPSP